LTDNKLGEGRFVTQSLLLLVEDVNDSEPVFASFPSAIEVPENSQPGILLTVEATDRDEGAYGQVVYYLEELDGDNEAFSISTTQGKGIIRLKMSLDYEKKSLYQLKVLAIDRANQGRINTGTAALVIKVKDLEDQGPEFVSQSPVTRISESVTKGSVVTTVRAIDGDRGINNKIKYSIFKGSNNMFKIDEDTGVITTLKVLDREDNRNLINGAYILEILAVERNSKVKPAPAVKTEITIILTDENDSTPSFRSNRYECEIAENAQQNTPVNFLQIDPKNEVFDYDLGNNGTFELYLDPPNDIFDISPRRSLNEATFIVRVRNPKILDYEKIKVLNFTIVAKEITADGKSSSVPLIVYIKDRNDNIPQFTKTSYNVIVPENISVGVSIAQLEAVDLDSGNFGTQGIRYTGITGSIAQLLNLDPNTGIITVKSTAGNLFDRELYDRHYLTVEAKDNLGEGNRNTIPLIIILDDINDNPPIFLQRKYETRLFENRKAFETLLQVEARDADVNGTRNSEVSYEIIDGEFAENFTINSITGVVKLSSPIDFEKLTRNHKSSIRPIQLTVQASDGGNPVQFSQVPVVINVQDENDFAPRFEKSSYETGITEQLEGGTSILTVRAIDLDGSAPNNAVFYRIMSGASDKFVIHSDTGVISVANGASLDPDLSDPKKKNYLLTVAALDGGDQQLSSTCIVNITVLDVNNKSPTFGELETVYIKENTPVGTLVYRLIASDLDNEPVLRYFFDIDTSEARTENGVIIKQTEYDFMLAFDLNPNEGLIRVVKMLDREKVETIKIGIMVEDIASKIGKQVAKAILNVVITDENDNNPKFQKPFYRRSIVENSQLGTTILNAVATDADKNKSVTYELEGPEEILNLVHLDAESGEIVVQEKIDHEIFQWLNFTIRAIDSGLPPRSSLADCFVQVIDENDNNPYFVTDFQNLTIYENQPIGTQIAVIEAHDADSGDFGKITFLIDRLSSYGKFAIDPESGVLKVVDKIDREVKSSYMIVIEIWDNYQFGGASGESRNAFKQFL
jgi:Cadherin domain